MTCDILLAGTGLFAARIAFDLAATATEPLRVVIAGRNAARRDWLVVAANARSTIFATPARFFDESVDLLAPGEAERLVARLAPRVIVQAASSQPSAVISRRGDAWSRLVALGGLSATALTQAQITMAMARANSRSGAGAAFVNCAFPDVVNAIVAAEGHAVLCGVGNVAILSNVFASTLDVDPGRLKTLAHYQTLASFRRPPAQREGRPPRVWIDGDEVRDVFARFEGVKLTPEPVIDVSGASGVPLLRALCTGRIWRGHAPGPGGLSGGYPVIVADGRAELDLPKSLTREEAIAWNASFESANGLTVSHDGRIRFHGLLQELLRARAPDIAAGFSIEDLDAATSRLNELRETMMDEPA